ncbi:MAG: asparagine--tRNA ligase [Candidatus Paceibacterota bacterium]
MVQIKKLYKNDKEFIGKDMELNGWVKTVRSSGGIGFLEITDGSFFRSLQAVFNSTTIFKKNGEEIKDGFEEIEKLPISSGVNIKGILQTSPAKGQLFELKATEVSLLATSDSDYPLQKKGHSMEFLRTIAHLRPRSNTFQAVFRLRSVLSFAVHKFFQEKGFVYVQTPIISTSDAEGAGEMFNVTTLDLKNISKNEKGEIDYEQDFFGKKAGLTVSGQLEGEATALAFGQIYTFGPTFRAENSHTSRHASEFWMIEPEISFAGLKEDMELAEEMMKYLVDYVLRELPEEMEFFNKFIDKTLLERLNKIKDAEFKHLTYSEAIEILEKSEKKFDYPPKWGIDLQTEHERYLTDEVIKGPVFITDYPKDIKAFYMRQNDDGKTVAAMDLLVPGVGEIIGGSQREERLENLEKRMDEMKLPKENYWWYLDLRKYGGVKHAGFGLGFERAIMYLSGMQNIRDVIPFPRTPGSADF